MYNIDFLYKSLHFTAINRLCPRYWLTYTRFNIFFFFFFFFFLILVLRPFQEYFTYIEPIVHRRWAKTGEPGEKPPDHPLAELGFPTYDPSGARTTAMRTRFNIHGCQKYISSNIQTHAWASETEITLGIPSLISLLCAQWLAKAPISSHFA